MTSQITINKKHYNGVILITSFANRLLYQLKIEHELSNKTDNLNTLFVEDLSGLLQSIKTNGQLSKEEKLRVFEIHNHLVDEFEKFFKLAPISQIDRISAIYASFMAEKHLQEELVQLNLLNGVSNKENLITQIAFYDEQIAYLNKVINLIKKGEVVSQSSMQQINRWYQNILSIKPQLMTTLNSVHLLLVEQ